MPTAVGQSPPGGSPVSEVSGEGGPWSVSIGLHPQASLLQFRDGNSGRPVSATPSPSPVFLSMGFWMGTVSVGEITLCDRAVLPCWRFPRLHSWLASAISAARYSFPSWRFVPCSGVKGVPRYVTRRHEVAVRGEN